MSDITFLPGGGSFKATPLQIAMFLMMAIFVAIIAGNVLINSNLSPQESESGEDTVDENIDEASLTIDGFRPFIPRTFKLLIENQGGAALGLKEFSVLSQEIKYDPRLFVNSPYQVIYKDDRFKVINTFPVDINDAILAHPAPGEGAENIDFPSTVDTYLYLPFNQKANSVALLRDGKTVFELPVPSYPEAETAPIAGASQTGGPIVVAVISDGYTDMTAFENDAETMISGMSTPPFNDVRSLFQFKLYKNTTPTGCTTDIVNCFNKAGLNSVLQAAYAETGATRAILLTRGGGTSAALKATGPAIINTSTGSIAWKGRHEFLGHVVGELHDRYFDKGAGYASYDQLYGRASNCSAASSGESWWGAAGAAGGFAGCAASSKFFAPFVPNCGNDGHNGTVMGLCGGQGFDIVERYWLENTIIPELNGQTNTSPGSNTGGGSVPNQPTVTLPGTCASGAYSVTFNWTGSGTNWFVDVSQNTNFSPLSNKRVDNLTTTDGPAGFTPAIQFQPGVQYNWRIVDDGQGTVRNGNPFSLPQCAAGQNPGSPVTQNPGTQNPGTQNPGTQNPGTQNPGTQNPTTNTPDANYSLNSGMADNLNYYGGDLPGAGYFSRNPISCQSDCQNNSLGTFCYAWSWEKATGRCWQKDKSHALCNYDTNVVSGAKPADDTNTCPIGPYPNNNPIQGAP